ncbi:histidine kinase dimerization/phosphoacceptor domain -containing protein (plasmid) [Spirosoma sp. SC4-14]|uniref:histidine kinase dimerization/phosphoacceptor domain -containing protein n=1 Tax=Spirosoma sp. SC4-14 TaxID=3128900 RepID=UPI0030CE71A9
MITRKQLLIPSIWCLFTLPAQAQLSAPQLDSVRHQLNRNRSDTTQVKLLLELGKYTLGLPTQTKANLDSTLLLFEQALTLSNRLGDQKWKEESLYLLGTYYFRKNELAQGKAYFTQVIKVYQQTGNKGQEGKAWFRLGAGLVKTEENYTEILTAYGHALALTNQVGDRQQEVIIRSAIGELHGIQGKLKESEQGYLRTLTIQKAIGDKSIYKTFFALSNIGFYRGDLHSALFYALKMVSNLEANGNKSQLDEAYFRLGNVYFELGQIDKSIETYRNSLAISRQKGQVIVDAAMAKKLARALLKQGKAQEALQFLTAIDRKNLPLVVDDKMTMAESFGECYAALKEYKRAEAYYLESIEWSKKTASWVALVANMGIGRFYVATKQFSKASPFLRKLLSAPQGQVPANILMEVHLMAFKVDSAAGRYVAAIAQYQQYKALNDSISNAVKSRQINEMEIQYETQKKEQQIQLLTEKEQRQQSELKRAQTTRYGFIAGAILLVSLLGVSFNRFRLKQHSHQLLESQKQEINLKNDSLKQVLIEKDRLLAEKEWMLKEIHHRVKNNLQIINSLLHSQGVYLTDHSAQSAIRESQNRVHAMALIHQKLYQSDHLANVELSEYIEEIVDYLITSFDRQDTIQKQIEVAPIGLDITLAVPLGLIINEAVTNSLKHAFPSGQNGFIAITLLKPDSKTYRLTIRDNGIGLPADLNPNRSRTLGMSLIRGLSKQLRGTLQIDQSDGVQISLQFTADRIDRGRIHSV